MHFILRHGGVLILTGCLNMFTLSTARGAFAKADDADPTARYDDYYSFLDQHPTPDQRPAYDDLVQQGILKCGEEKYTCEPTPASKADIVVVQRHTAFDDSDRLRIRRPAFFR